MDRQKPSFLLKLLVRVSRIAVLTLLGLLLYVRIFEKRLIYYPMKHIGASPQSPYEEIFFNASDGPRLHAWFIPRPESPFALLMSHGNAGNISDRSEMADYLAAEFDMNVLAYDYRGYGKSEGEPSERGTYADIRAAYSWLLSRGYPPPMIFVFGQSLGTAITVDLAAELEVGGVVLEAPFTSVGALARPVAFGLPVDYVLSTRYDSLSKLQKIRAPVAVIHAKGDPDIPFSMGVELYEGLPGRKRFFEVQGELHEGALLGLGLERTRELKNFILSSATSQPDSPPLR